MNNTDKIEARKAYFDMYKVFLNLCTCVYSYMVMNYVKFKHFTPKYRNYKKNSVII